MESQIANASQEVDEMLIQLSSVLEDSLLKEAASLARQGRYSAAEALLSELNAPSVRTKAALDLLARIKAQQGCLAEAERLWRQAAQMPPDNPADVLALDAVCEAQRCGTASVWPTLCRAGAVILVALFVVIVAYQTLENRSRLLRLSYRVGTLFDAARAVEIALKAQTDQAHLVFERYTALGHEMSNRLAGISLSQQKISEDLSNHGQMLAALDASQSQTANVLSNTVASIKSARSKELELGRQSKGVDLQGLKDIRTALQDWGRQFVMQSGASLQGTRSNTWELDADRALTGVIHTKSANQLTFHFERGLFERSLLMRKGARDQVIAVGRQVARLGDGLKLEVVGCVREVPLFHDRTSLALRRAEVVARILSEPAGVPFEKISIRAAAPNELPLLDVAPTDGKAQETAFIQVSRSP